MTEQELEKHRQTMLDHLMRKQELLMALSKLLDKLDRYQMAMPAHHRLREEGRLLIEATDMLHRIVEEVIPNASKI